MLYCKSCGKPLPDNSAFCTNCGTPLASDTDTTPPQQAPQTATEYSAEATPVPVFQTITTSLPEKTPTIGNYILWQFVSIIPLIGWIIAIVWAVDSSWKARANYFRALFVIMLIGLLAGGGIALLVVLLGGVVFSF